MPAGGSGPRARGIPAGLPGRRPRLRRTRRLAAGPRTGSHRWSRSEGSNRRCGPSPLRSRVPRLAEGSHRPQSRSSERRINAGDSLALFARACHRPQEQRLWRAPPSMVRVPINQDRLRKMTDHGLTEYQARVYLTLLDLGSATASQISPLSKVPRTRIYATMQQLHEKGLVQILPETPLRYKAVPFATYLQTLADDMRSRAKQIDTGLDGLAREFAISAQREPESRGRFEAIYGRKNVRERLLKMYDGATREVIAIWTDDPAIADAMSEMAERIWEMGKPAADVLEEGREAKRVAVTRP